MKKHASWLVVALACALPSVSFADSACYANFMFVLDRSCSMNDPLTAGGTTSKWQYAGDAINKLMTAANGQASFGLTFFPDVPSAAIDMSVGACSFIGSVTVPIATDSAAAITKALAKAKNAPGSPCQTPIVPGIMQAGTEPHLAQTYTSGDRTYAILITDGEPTCNETTNDVVAAVQELYTRGYPTFVVGFGGAVSPSLLDAAAQAGGVPRTSFVDDAGVPYDAGGLSYYQADDEASLDAALSAILGQVVGEFSTCAGTPCPDGRCYSTGMSCVGGFCITSGTGMGTLDDASASAADGGGAKDVGKAHGGCGCEVGGRPAVGGGALFMLAAAIGLSRRRRAVRVRVAARGSRR